ncbi:YicC/YloC family endoribonuclease [Nitrosomonas oligotropha]|uniref:TIGR00255 family protein n=1 Tax=Nitrosomonas oligotropha TaxID=42354 RepID=A0A1H8MAL0_9PROT|nr:YicC/YloC family endoribonuclease [Nitrosomonas oligotropha]SDW48266.1 TIGR00255 family protein [Nitrosomonas oligotropha]SEO14401.1 TIGR00255 family protein [Nitrosomonas oligotropha]
MIVSMTGYAAATQEMPYGSFNLEIRSVNNRYLDIQFRLPDDFRKLEPAMRELLTKQLSRGKVECRLNFSPSANTENSQQLDHTLLDKLLQLEQTVKTRHPAALSLTVAEILKWPGMLGSDMAPGEESDEIGMTLLQTALNDLKAARIREGDKLKSVLLERIKQMRQLLQSAAPRIPALIAAFEEKLRTRLEEILGTQENERIHQEITLFASKIDVDEELSRLQAHIDEVERIINKGGAVGKQLDFMMQELHREANTIGSKSVDLEITRISMELKVIIEQMREQVQNIE